ncbi:uncharacterized protein LACBIDRAFT_304935 [Laccaria bicolor S238N-H82]|uniref:Predicted protein n=1 Tax=Laccaria bicolor (strain S238N-H82 / ATCC MYA-4686) TaxID=486041 RepID=B0DMP3_LACBS|nr:uncharacterized protein LACBIDRAFT_304935 [Laccaria bicolor S238N-H82]EDR04223.1 predicted protein [Laccaria bicolor S238N-H82]|eukprot:XP_001885114.1 predicted protein [Laccaria bicolor S238N-H82]
MMDTCPPRISKQCRIDHLYRDKLPSKVFTTLTSCSPLVALSTPKQRILNISEA